MDEEVRRALDGFLRDGRFNDAGAVLTDLDGTALLEREGRLWVAPEVEFGLKRLADLGRPVGINTLRFPLNVVRTFGRAWTAITEKPLPFVSLNGAVTGHIVSGPGDTVAFEELDAVTLTPEELEEVLEGVRGLVEGGVTELLFFFYPRNWTEGEIIWTPDPGRVDPARAKYRSASEVFQGTVADLRARLTEREVAMLFLLVEAPGDRLMAYQHAVPSSFVTHKGLDKLAGAERLAGHLGFDLGASVGAGDTPMDSFLRGCGLAVQVGPNPLEHRGLSATVRVPDPPALGEVLRYLAVRPEGATPGLAREAAP